MNETIRNSSSEKIDYTFREGASAARNLDWIVIVGHGVTGNKDRPVVTDTTAALNGVGFDTLRFSFSGNGDSEGDFRSSTVSKEVGDLDSVLSATRPSYSKVCYIGHSMGCAVGVIQAAKGGSIDCLVSLAGMVNTKAFVEAEFGDVELDAGVMWEDGECPLSSAYWNDLHETVATVEPLAEVVGVPWLLVHGTADDVVLPADTAGIEDLKGDGVTAVYIDGADHSFSELAHKSQMTEAVVDWLVKQASRA